MTRYTDAVKLQEKLAPIVITKDKLNKIQTVCGVDVSYKNNDAYAAAVIIDAKTLEVIKQVRKKIKVKTPYVPGLMMLRESKPALSAIKSLKQDFDLLLVDGNGRLHPRKCGLACYLGIILDKPTIGIAKSLLGGKISGSSVILYDEILGGIIEKKGKKIFVSVGHKISLKTALKITGSLVKEGQWLPEPLRLADRLSKDRTEIS
ncbi:MAG: endonuclease V [Thaumarchaeota archaeon]|nr:endonuclease V [Nitrososphaerota archaeon]